MFKIDCFTWPVINDGDDEDNDNDEEDDHDDDDDDDEDDDDDDDHDTWRKKRCWVISCTSSSLTSYWKKS